MSHASLVSRKKNCCGTYWQSLEYISFITFTVDEIEKWLIIYSYIPLKIHENTSFTGDFDTEISGSHVLNFKNYIKRPPVLKILIKPINIDLEKPFRTISRQITSTPGLKHFTKITLIVLKSEVSCQRAFAISFLNYNHSVKGKIQKKIQESFKCMNSHLRFFMLLIV